MKNFITAAAIFAATTGISTLSANADSITLNTEMQAVSIHTGGIDMVAYYLKEDDHFALTATYLEPSDPRTPLQINMALRDGDSTSFQLPVQNHVTYSFKRSGTSITIDAQTAPTKVALK